MLKFLHLLWLAALLLLALRLHILLNTIKLLHTLKLLHPLLTPAMSSQLLSHQLLSNLFRLFQLLTQESSQLTSLALSLCPYNLTQSAFNHTQSVFTHTQPVFTHTPSTVLITLSKIMRCHFDDYWDQLFKYSLFIYNPNHTMPKSSDQNFRVFHD